MKVQLDSKLLKEEDQTRGNPLRSSARGRFVGDVLIGLWTSAPFSIRADVHRAYKKNCRPYVAYYIQGFYSASDESHFMTSLIVAHERMLVDFVTAEIIKRIHELDEEPVPTLWCRISDIMDEVGRTMSKQRKKWRRRDKYHVTAASALDYVSAYGGNPPEPYQNEVHQS